MRGWLAENKGWRAMTAEVGIALALIATTMTLSMRALAQGQGPALTTISDTVYRADGTAAAGTVLISWPSFQTAQGQAVTAGNLAVTIGAQGAFTAQLVPNVGATPTGTYYVAVFQLDDGTVRTEYWAVPTTSPTTIAGVVTTPGTGLGNLVATQQYVNETVAAAVANVGAGAFVPLAGGTMTGPLTLPADPVAPNQAADRNYVDNGLHLFERELHLGSLRRGRAGGNHVCDDGAELDRDDGERDHGRNAGDGDADALPGGRRYDERIRLSGVFVGRRKQRSGQRNGGGGGMHVGSGVGNDHVYSFLFVCGGIHDWVGVVGDPGDGERGLRDEFDDVAKQPVQCDDSGEWAGVPGALAEHVQRVWHDLSAHEPIGIERGGDIAELRGAGRVRAGWGSGEFERLHGYDGERAKFSLADESGEQCGICGSGDHANAEGVAGSDDHDGERARLSGWGHGDDPVYRQQQLLGRRDDHGGAERNDVSVRAHGCGHWGTGDSGGGGAGVCRGAGQRDEHAPDRHCLRQGRGGWKF